jgi:hypothetical protein
LLSDRDLPQAASREAALAGFVFLDLLEGDPQQRGKRFLRQTQFPPCLPHFLADEPICVGRLSRLMAAGVGRTGHICLPGFKAGTRSSMQTQDQIQPVRAKNDQKWNKKARPDTSGLHAVPRSG